MRLPVVDEFTYEGPNIYLQKQSLVLTVLAIEPADLNKMQEAASAIFPSLADEPEPYSFVARSIVEVQRLGLFDLYPRQIHIAEAADRATIAVEYFHRSLGWACVDFVLDWFGAVAKGSSFDYADRYQDLERIFRRSVGGGPTIYRMLDSAYQRRIPVRFLEPETVYQFGYGKNQQRGRSTIMSSDSHKDTELTCQKQKCKDLLEELGLPVPRGDFVFDLEEARRTVEMIGFPVVVKPVAGHKGIGVTTNIQSDQELEDAISQLVEGPDSDDEIIVESFVTGTDHRLLVVGGRFAAALQRIPPFVIGDGKRTIVELIAIENEKPEREGLNPRAPMNAIPVDEITDTFIDENYGYTRETVLAEDERIELRGIANLSAGGVSLNRTAETHPDNVRLAEAIAAYLDVAVFGIDVLAGDISRSWKDEDNPFAVIELNAGPGIMMHTAPAIGEPVDTPNMIWDHFFPTFESARVPIIVVNRASAETIDKLTTTIQRYTNFDGIGFCSRAGVFVNGGWLLDNQRDYSLNVIYLLRNPKVDIAVIEYWSEEIERYGLYFEGADAILLDQPDEIEKKVLGRELLPGGRILDADDASGFEALLAELVNRYGRSKGTHAS